MSARLSRLAPLAIVLLGFALRVLELGRRELTGDEAFGYFFSLRAPGDIVAATLELQEPHPVASYLLQHGWLAQAGHTEFALRFLSVLFGTLGVALLFRLALALRLPRVTGLAASLLLAVSVYAVWHAQVARMYAMSLALTLASTWLMVEIERSQRLRWLVAYAGVALLALHTHYFAGFVILAQNLWFLWRALRSRAGGARRIGWWLGGQAIIVLAYLPWLLVAAPTLGGYHGNGETLAFLPMVMRTLRMFATGDTLARALRDAAALSALALAVLALVATLQDKRRLAPAFALAALCAGLPVIATWLSALSRPIFNERYLVAAAPAFYLLLCIPLSRPKPVAAGVLLGILLALNAAALASYYGPAANARSPGWAELARVLRASVAGLPQDRAEVVANYPDPSLWYYFPQQGARRTLPPGPNDAEGSRRMVAELAGAGVVRVVVPLQPASGWDPGDIARSALGERYRLVHRFRQGSWPVEVYELPPAFKAPLDIRFGEAIGLRAAEATPPALRPGGVVTVYLRWSAEAAAEGLTATVQLLGPDGALVTQSDRPLAPLPDDGVVVYPLAAPQSLPAGEYRVIAAVYDARQATLPRLPTQAGTDHVEIAKFTVE